MTEKILPALETWRGLNIVGDDETRAAEIETTERLGCETFIASTPGYHSCDFNSGMIAAWLDKRGVPATFWNLTIAYRDLSQEGLLAPAPPAAPEVDTGNPSITLTVTDRLAEYQPSNSESAALAKLRDDFALSDHQRKARDRKLALLAGQQRREFSGLPPNADPPIVI